MKAPPGVHAKHGAWYLVRKNKWHRLCRVDEGEAALYLALAKISEARPETLRQIFPLYLAWAEIKPATRHDYTRIINGILTFKFGHMHPDDLTASDVGQFLEERKRQDAAVAGNRERAVLSAVYEFCLRHGYARANPCRGVARNTETPRRRYVTTEELQAAVDRAPKHTALLLAFAYGTAMRMTDIVALRRTDVRDDGIHWVESKTGKSNFLPWSPWLRGVVADLRAHSDEWAEKKKRPPVPELVTNRYGRRWTYDGIKEALRRLKVTWTFRDLRAKAETDRPGATGHMGQMQERYIKVRKLRPV